MSNMHLWPRVIVVGQDFSKEKSLTVPNQNLTLRDILLRFIRKESLPVEHDGTYAENLGDLEKMQHEDLTVRHERAQNIRNRLRDVKNYHDNLSKKPVESPAPGPTPSGVVTGSPGQGQAPPASPPV